MQLQQDIAPNLKHPGKENDHSNFIRSQWEKIRWKNLQLLSLSFMTLVIKIIQGIVLKIKEKRKDL